MIYLQNRVSVRLYSRLSASLSGIRPNRLTLASNSFYDFTSSPLRKSSFEVVFKNILSIFPFINLVALFTTSATELKI